MDKLTGKKSAEAKSDKKKIRKLTKATQKVALKNLRQKNKESFSRGDPHGGMSDPIHGYEM